MKTSIPRYGLLLKFVCTVALNYNHFHNSLRLFDVLHVRVASRVAERLQT